MSRRHELSARQWAGIEPLLPARKRGGRPRADEQQTLNGIGYVLKTGCAWEELPRRYGSATTCWRRLQQWSADGTWERIWRTLLATLDRQGKIEWRVAAKKGVKAAATATKGGVHVSGWSAMVRAYP